MKRSILLLLLITAISCKSDKTEIQPPESATPEIIDTISQTPVKHEPTAEKFENARFKDVTITRTGDNKFQVEGKAQVFEAAFSWVVEDGHNELKAGHEMTDAGTPEFGEFNFIVDVAKAEPNSTLHLILYESSPKDGSRQHELMIPLK